MNEKDLIETETYKFDYIGHGQTYSIDVFSIDGAPWFSLPEVMRVLSSDERAAQIADGAFHVLNTGKSISAELEMMKQRLGLEIDQQDQKWITQKNVLVRVSAFFELSLASKLSVVRPFRKQAGKLLEAKWIEAQNTEAKQQISTTGNPMADMAFAIQQQAGIVGNLILKQDRISKMVEEHQKKLDLLTGGDFSRTARLRLMERSINPTVRYGDTKMTNAQAVGNKASTLCRQRGIPLPEKIVEGTTLANQYPIEILDEVIGQMGLVH